VKVILPPSVPASLLVIVYDRDGETVIELTDRPGNVGKRGEVLEDAGKPAGRIVSFKEERK
jgi:hypothetical protein